MDFGEIITIGPVSARSALARYVSTDLPIPRPQHSLPELAELTRCWREAAQQALADLRQRLQERGQQTDMAQLLRHLGIDPLLVRYDAEEEAFLDADGT